MDALRGTAMAETPTPTLCLNMIVKNESRIIERLIQTVLPLIDTYCICDTGSTDDTVQRIERTMAAAGISGEVFTEPFRNFGYNRTVALERMPT
jgi:glycosyltransferase involved in cell wall biosynthesis